MIGFHTSGGCVAVVFALGIMGIKSVFPCAAAREMLCGEGDTVFVHLLSLDSADHTGDDLTDQFRFLAESTVGTEPAGICGTVRHVHVTFADICRIKLVMDNLGKPVDQIHISGSGKSQRTGESRKFIVFLLGAVMNIRAFVFRVCGNQAGDTEPCTFAHFLHRIDPLSQLAGGSVFTYNKVTDMAGGKFVGGRILHIFMTAHHNFFVSLGKNTVMAGRLAGLGRDTHRLAVDDQHSCFFLIVHTSDKVFSTLFRRKTPILIRLQLTGTIQILKTQAVHFQHTFCAGDNLLLFHMIYTPFIVNPQFRQTENCSYYISISIPQLAVKHQQLVHNRQKNLLFSSK